MTTSVSNDAANLERRRSRLPWLLPLAAVLIGGAAYVRTRLAPRPAAPISVPGPISIAEREPADAELAELERAAASSPRDTEAALALGAKYAKLGRNPEALAEFQRASRLDPRLLPARVGQGQIWMRLSRPGPAVEHLQWAVQRVPENAELRLELASALIALRDVSAAVRELQKAVELAPDAAEAHRALATGYATILSMDAAVQEAERAVELVPTDAANWSELGSVHLGANHFEEAVKALRRSLELRPESTETNYLLANALLEKSNTPEARREAHGLLLRALSGNPFDKDSLHQLGKFYLEEGKLDGAVATLRRAREADPEATKVMMLLGQALVRRGDAEEGRALVAKAQSAIDKTVDFRGLEFQAERNPNPNVQLRLANLYLTHGRLDSAIHILRKAVRQNPGDAQLRQRLQLALDRARRSGIPEAR